MGLEIDGDLRVSPPCRDTVEGLSTDGDPPTIVSISDIHGYLDSTRSALLTLRDHPAYDPVVTADADSTLHWANENYVLVFNGDLVDRGPANEETLSMVARLIAEAPPGHVRVTLGNHEAIMLSPDHFGFGGWYSGQVTQTERETFLEQILAGHVITAYEGHNVVYAHAGSTDQYDVTAVNNELHEAADELLEALGRRDDRSVQQAVLSDYHRVLGTGDVHPKRPDAGLVWLDFEYFAPDAPAQVVGHTRHREPVTKGNVFCQNVIRETLDTEGGEAVFVETPTDLTALIRDSNGDVTTVEMASF